MEKIKILVTDSGLGGLSVFEDLSTRLQNNTIAKNVDLIFVDALFDENSGYNRLDSEAEKISIFSSALAGMTNYFEPDIIFIACNTLSVLYKDTLFAKANKLKVVDIVDFGVELIEDELSKADENQVIIFATETTIHSGTHKNELLKRGVEEEQIYTKACPHLASYIEKNPVSRETEILIDRYVHEALQDVDNETNLCISLNCTHYGYSLEFWENAFLRRGIKLTNVLNPNNMMADVLYENHPVISTDVNLSHLVASKVPMSAENQAAMMSLFSEINSDVSDAIRYYRLLPDLF